MIVAFSINLNEPKYISQNYGTTHLKKDRSAVALSILDSKRMKRNGCYGGSKARL